MIWRNSPNQSEDPPWTQTCYLYQTTIVFMSRRFRSLQMAVGVFFFAMSMGLAQEEIIVYHNARHSLKRFFNPRTEYGDEVILESESAPIGSVHLTQVSIRYAVSKLSGDEEAVIRFYRNDGPELSDGIRAPGSVFFDSGRFDLQSSIFGNEFSIDLGLDLDNVPSSFTWTIEFFNLEIGESAGLVLYNPPIIGNAFDDYWERTSDGWALKQARGLPTNFAALMIADRINPPSVEPDPPTTVDPPVLSGDLRLVIEANGNSVNLEPIEEAHSALIEFSEDLRVWTPLSYSPWIESPESAVNLPLPGGRVGFVRAGAFSPFVLELPKQDGGDLTLDFGGAPHLIYTLESSTDLENWQGVQESKGNNFRLVDFAEQPERYFRVSTRVSSGSP